MSFKGKFDISRNHTNFLKSLEEENNLGNWMKYGKKNIFDDKQPITDDELSCNLKSYYFPIYIGKVGSEIRNYLRDIEDENGEYNKLLLDVASKFVVDNLAKGFGLIISIPFKNTHINIADTVLYRGSLGAITICSLTHSAFGAEFVFEDTGNGYFTRLDEFADGYFYFTGNVGGTSLVDSRSINQFDITSLKYISKFGLDQHILPIR